MYAYGPLHMAEQNQDDQLEHTYSSYVRIRDVALKTCRRRWTIGRSGMRGSGIFVLVARHDDDYCGNKFTSMYIRYACGFVCPSVMLLSCLYLSTSNMYVGLYRSSPDTNLCPHLSTTDILSGSYLSTSDIFPSSYLNTLGSLRVSYLSVRYILLFVSICLRYVSKIMDCGIVVSKFVLQSCYYVHFQTNTLGEGMNPLILPAMN